MTTILTTTGISLHLNTSREYKTVQPTDDQMRQFLRVKPEAASAEANSLIQIAEPDDNLVLLHTETPEAVKCAKLLKEFFINDRGFKHEPSLVKLEFQDDEKHIETQGLRNLVNTLIDEIEKAQRNNQDIIINATSGFKPEIGYSTMIGMLYQVPVKYMHEKFRRVVTFNPIALDWDTSLFLTYNKFFQWIDEEARQQRDIEERLKALPDRERIQALLTLPDEKGYIFLSAMGEALRRRFVHEAGEAEAAAWPQPAEVENIEEKIASSLRNRKHHSIKNILFACRRIAELPYVREIIGGNFIMVPRNWTGE